MLILAAIACLIGATVQSAIGFGFALILAPALFAAVEPRAALTTMLILSVAINLFLLGTERRRAQVLRPEVGRMLVAALPGLLLGALVFGALSKQAIQIGVGVLVLVAAAIDWRATLPGLREGHGRPTLPLNAALPCGLAAGFLTTTTSTNGPPMVLLLRGRGATPSELRDSNAMLLGILGVAALLTGSLLGSGLDLDPLLLGLLFVLTAAGQFAGRLLFARLDPARFHIAGLAVVLLTGLVSLAAGLGGLG